MTLVGGIERAAEEADAAALQEAQKTAGEDTEGDPDVDEGALPEEVNKEDLDNLLNKEAEEVADADVDESEHNNAVEEGLHQVVEDALAGVSAEADVSDDDEEEEEDADDTNTRDSSTKVSRFVDVLFVFV